MSLRPTLEDIRAARRRIEGEVVHTPCTRSLVFGDQVPGRLFFKFENLQRTGAFKDRGALNKLAQLDDGERARGVVTASAGNHAQAVAYQASRLGIPLTVVMPEHTPLIKVSNTRRYGARVKLLGPRFDDAMNEARRIEEDEGLVMVHPFDDPAVIAGQGTIALEILEQVPDVTVAVVPIGGGGLIAGIALGLKALRPEVRVVGVEAAAAPSALESRRAGRLVAIESADTLADGISVKRIGDHTFPLVEELVDDIVLVSEEEIASAILLLLEREKTVVEGAGAAGPAALLTGKIRVDADDVVVPVLSGGNIDVNMLSRIIDRGLVSDGRLVRLMVRMRDRPGSLAWLTRAIADGGANVLEIAHRRAFADISVGDVEIVVHLETRGREHVSELVASLEGKGLHVEEEV